MKQSRRARRMERHHRRHGQTGVLSLVSLMDIFTILVFFLLVSSAPVSPLPHRPSITLPASSADTPPKDRDLVIEVSPESLRLQGRPVLGIDEALLAQTGGLPRLRAAFEALSDVRRSMAKGHLTIMGDGQIPYRLLQRILETCQEAGYPHIALAIRHRAPSR